MGEAKLCFPCSAQDEYRKVTAETIKPFWESHGRQAYRVWQSQEGPKLFMKEMVFEDESSLKGAMAGGCESVAGVETIKELFYRFTSVISRTIYALAE